MKSAPERIPATRHEAIWGEIAVTQVLLDAPPVAVVSELESVVGGWWYRAGGYPVGRGFGTPITNPRSA